MDRFINDFEPFHLRLSNWRKKKRNVPEPELIQYKGQPLVRGYRFGRKASLLPSTHRVRTNRGLSSTLETL